MNGGRLSGQIQLNEFFKEQLNGPKETLKEPLANNETQNIFDIDLVELDISIEDLNATKRSLNKYENEELSFEEFRSKYENIDFKTKYDAVNYKKFVNFNEELQENIINDLVP